MPSSVDEIDRVQLGSSRVGWHVAAVELWTLWQKRPTLRRRAVIAVVWRYVPLKLKVAAFSVVALTLLLFAAAVTALVIGLNHLG